MDIVLWENTEAQLVEIALLQLQKSVLEDGLRLMGPGVAGRPHRIIGGAVLIGEMVGVGHPDGAVVPRRRRRDQKRARRGIVGKACRDFKGVLPFKGGHEAHLI